MQDLLNKNLSSDESDDEDYVPTEAEIKADDENKKKSQKGSGLYKNKKKTLEEIMNDMKQEWEDSMKKRKNQTEQIETLNIKELLDKVNKDRPAPQMIKFAGKTFNLSDANVFEGPEKSPQPVETIMVDKEQAEPDNNNNNTNELEIPPLAEPKEITLGQKFDYLKSLLKTIDAKNINSMTKSRYDWKDYTKKENMEKQFNENRKDGYLEKMKFLEKSKQEEKEYIKARKKVKTT